MNARLWQQVDHLLHAALRRPPAERATFVTDACAGDESLQLEIESLLAAHERAGGFLEAPAIEVAARQMAVGSNHFKPGDRIGPYRVHGVLGAGGMGELYRASDPRLGRDVAIKVLPVAFSRDPDRLRRLEQEARAAGMLNHPNIVTIYDVGTFCDSSFIVSELLEGEDLGRRLARGDLPTTTVIDFALQIARGLLAAHAKGIVHRDLKPQNVFVANDGRVKILDFGLAKLTNDASTPANEATLPSATLTTLPGVLVGTVGYMSPEQVRGQAADARSDLFAVGAIVYEMLAGRRAFVGQSSSAVMSAILSDEPPKLTTLNSGIARSLDLVVRRCLEKQPDRRFQTSADLADALEALVSATPSQLRSKRGRALAIGVLAAATMVFSSVFYFRRSPTEVRSAQLSIALPRDITHVDDAVISPDGRMLAFTAAGSDTNVMLWVRPLDSTRATPLPATDNARKPFWSPDSRYIGFFTPGAVKTIAVSGGQAQVLSETSTSPVVSGSWNDKGQIIFSKSPGSEIFLIAAGGGDPRPVTMAQEDGHRWPSFLPDGRHFLYYANASDPDRRAVHLGSVDSVETRLLFRSESAAIFAPPGYLLFLRGGSLVAQAFDPRELKVVGEPMPIAEQVLRGTPGWAPISVSHTGVVTYLTDVSSARQLEWLDRNGRQIGALGSNLQVENFRLSPDGKHLAGTRVDRETGLRDVWLADLERGTAVRFAHGSHNHDDPIWSPDGRSLVYDRQNPEGLFQASVGGIGPNERLIQQTMLAFGDDWSSDGRFIVFASLTPETKSRDIWVLPMFGERKPFAFLATSFEERQARLSPDGRWIAYASNETGRFEIYVQSFPAGGNKIRISTAGGTFPKWRHDGKELFYLSVDERVVAVDVRQSSDHFAAGFPKPLFGVRVGFLRTNPYEVTPDGHRFLVSTIDRSDNAPIAAILNWTATIKP